VGDRQGYGVRQRSVWWIAAVAATALAIAIPAVLWQTWSGAAIPTAPRAASGKRAKRVVAASSRASDKDKAAKQGAADARASAGVGAVGTVFFDRDGTPLARLVALQFTDPAEGGPPAPTGQRDVQATIAMQNLTSAPLQLNPTMFRVRDVKGGLHAPTTRSAAAATPVAAQQADSAVKPTKAAKAAKSAKPAKEAKAATGARQSATPRPRASNRPTKDAAAPASSGGASIELEPGQTKTETLRFAVPATTRIASILFAPDQDHLVSLAILPQQAASMASAAGSGAHANRAAKPAKARATPQH
jgi:hypothetical protein